MSEIPMSEPAAAPIEQAAPEIAEQPAAVSHEDSAAATIEEVGARVANREASETSEALTGNPERPIAWSPDDQALWDSLTPAAQQKIAHREDQARKKITELGMSATEAKTTFGAITQKYRDVIPAQMPVPAMLDHLLAAHQALTQNPQAAIQFLAKNYGVDLRALGPQPDHRAAARTQAYALADAESRALIESFSSSAQDWADVESDVYEQVIALRASNPKMPPNELLRKAYDRAKRVSDRYQEKQRKAEEAKRTEEQKKKAEEARKLGSFNVKSGATPVRRAGTWEQTLRAVGERIA